VDTQDLWSYLIKDNSHKEQNSRQPETRIMKKTTLHLSLYKPFRSSFKTVHVFVEKAVLQISALQMSGKNRIRLESSLGCLDKSNVQNFLSISGSENKLLQLVLVRVLT